MLILIETAAGYGLVRVGDKKTKKLEADEILTAFESKTLPMSLHAWQFFKDSKQALELTSALIEGSLDKKLAKFLQKNTTDSDILCVQDKSLASAIASTLDLQLHTNAAASLQLYRGVREQLSSLVEGLDTKSLHQMSLGLAHTVNRFKLKFSPEKVDTMIVQAVGLLDDLDKELNNFAMRLREWYGWHFPELAKIVGDNLVYAKLVLTVGYRTEVKTIDENATDAVTSAEILVEVKKAAEVSMGVEITDEDLMHIKELAERVVELSVYRKNLAEYLAHRMQAISPNLTYMVGELIGARLISHAGSLMNLAKHPSSTVQILGAEKALFRALKTRQSTPKYGLIYHASIVGQSQPSAKGKISRVLAAKLSLCARVDALGEGSEVTVGRGYKEYVEKKLKDIEAGPNAHPAKRGGDFGAGGQAKRPRY
jgi:nucleolar protein 58